MHSIILTDSGVEVNAKFRSPTQALEFVKAVHNLLYVMSDKALRELVLQKAEECGWATSSAINLIKAYRMITGEGLKESKDWVEANMTDYYVKGIY